jgi:hypothetical protein
LATRIMVCKYFMGDSSKITDAHKLPNHFANKPNFAKFYFRVSPCKESQRHLSIPRAINKNVMRKHHSTEIVL